MKKAIIISFYQSTNIGDLELSLSIENIIKNQNYSIIRYDFTSGRKIDLHSDNIYTNSIHKQDSNFLLGVKKLLKLLVGVYNYEVLVWKLFHRKKVYKNPEFEHDFKSCDVLIFAGGNMVMDLMSTWPYLIKNYVDIAHDYGKSIYFLYVGVGPLFHKKSKTILSKSFLKIQGISVRDSFSEVVVKELISEAKITLTVDPVFSGALHIDNKKSIDEGITNIGLCVLGEMCFSSKADHMLYIDGLKIIIKKIILLKINVCMFSTEISDYDAINSIKLAVKENEEYLNIYDIKNIHDVFELYNNLDFLIGGRMHSMILAQKRLVPFLGISWQAKILGFAEITNTTYKIFDVDTMNNSSSKILEIILKEIKSNEVIKNMHLHNIELEKLVCHGNIVSV